MSGNKASGNNVQTDHAKREQRFADLNGRFDAAAQVLRAIAASRDDAQPIFDLIVGLAKDHCGAVFAGLVLGRKGDQLFREQ